MLRLTEREVATEIVSTCPLYACQYTFNRVTDLSRESLATQRDNQPHHGDDVKNYRCKRAVEALRWTDTDADREAFSEWFDQRGVLFETRGPIALLPNANRDPGDEHNGVQPGEWVVWSDGVFFALNDKQFTADYEEISPWWKLP